MQYDVSGVAKDAKLIVPVFLGLWHPAKQVSLLIWRRMASTLLAPLVHHIQPDSHYYMKPTLTKVTRWFVMIRLAFKNVRDDFIRVRDAHLTSPGQKRLAASIVETVDHFIVTVLSAHHSKWSLNYGVPPVHLSPRVTDYNVHAAKLKLTFQLSHTSTSHRDNCVCPVIVLPKSHVVHAHDQTTQA